MNNTQNTDKTFGRKWPNYVVALFVLVSVAVAGLFAWQQYSLKQKETQLLVAIETQKQNLLELKEREKIGEKMKAAEILNKAKKYRRNWSEVLEDLNETFTSRGEITFKTVSVDATNAVSVSGQAKDMLTAANFLMMVKKSDKFDNGFISVISPGATTESGVSQYGFNATFDYLGDTEATSQTNINSNN